MTASTRRPLTRKAVTEQLRSLGVEAGGVLLVHTSWRAVRPVEGGPRGLVDALLDALGPEGTLVMPSWSGEDDRPFDPRRDETSPGLGILPDLFWRRPGVLRSGHVHAFAAIGPRADAVLRDALPLPPHRPESPAGRVHELDGQVLLLGVDHDANTTVHLAECVAEVPYGIPKYLTVLRDGAPVRVDYLENDHCCARFREVGGWLEESGAQRTGPVGHATARLVRSRAVVDAVVPRLRADPLHFLHPPAAGCEECDLARASVARPR